MKQDWVTIWIEDKKSMISTMLRNLASDLAVGYDPMGESARRQKNMIDEYEKTYYSEMDRLKEMGPSKANWWCYMDLKKRGAIS